MLNRNQYSNHVFLVFNEAYEILNGMQVYKEVYIKYGIGQAIINVVSLYLFGSNWFSIYLTANIFYFLSIFFVLLTSIKLKFDASESFFLIIILINIHPKLVMPWANYLAFLPLSVSLYLLLLEEKKINLFFAGFLLATACLIRETILVSAIIILIFISIHLMIKEKRNYIYPYFAGFFLPLLVFIIYMLTSSNYLFWHELIYSTYKYESLRNFGYYINDENTDLRKIYIYLLGPFRSLFLTFIDTLLNFWTDWILVYASYALCAYVIYKWIFKKNQNNKINSQLIIISIYSLSLIIQCLNQVEIFRISTSSIFGILVLNFFFIKIIKNIKIKNSIYIITLVLLYLNSYGTWARHMTNKKFYELSFFNIKENFRNIFINENIIDYKKIKEFGIMNYDISIHEFFNKFRERCTDLVKERDIKYSYNHDHAWELNYFCGTRPAYYYLFPSKEPSTNFLRIYNDAKYIKKNDSTNKNTIEFFLLDEIYLKEYDILHIFNVEDLTPHLFFGKKYLLITQKK